MPRPQRLEHDAAHGAAAVQGDDHAVSSGGRSGTRRKGGDDEARPRGRRHANKRRRACWLTSAPCGKGNGNSERVLTPQDHLSLIASKNTSSAAFVEAGGSSAARVA